jgi:hypothetical protein
MDSTQDGLSRDPERWAELLNLESQRVWQPEEFGDILQHQLTAPIQLDLGGVDPEVAPKLKTLTEAEGLLLKSFNDLFRHPHPPIELLQLVKDYAKANRHHPRSHLPHEIAAVIYYLSIVVARLRCRRRITQMRDEELQRGVDWVLTLPWVDDQTKASFREARECLVTADPKPADEQQAREDRI